MLGLTRLPNAACAGRCCFDGVDLLGLPADELRALRGERIAMVFQDPLSSLHPLYTVGWQIEEAIRAHERRLAARRARRARSRRSPRVGIPNPAERSTATRTSSRAGCGSAR